MRGRKGKRGGVRCDGACGPRAGHVKRADAGGNKKEKKGGRLQAGPPAGRAEFRAWERKRKTGPFPEVGLKMKNRRFSNKNLFYF